MDGGVTGGFGRKIEWARVLNALRAHGWGPYKIGQALNVPHVTVCHWANHGVEPTWRNGAGVLDLYAVVVLGEPASVRFAVNVESRKNMDAGNALLPVSSAAPCQTPSAPEPATTM